MQDYALGVLAQSDPRTAASIMKTNQAMGVAFGVVAVCVAVAVVVAVALNKDKAPAPVPPKQQQQKSITSSFYD